MYEEIESLEGEENHAPWNASNNWILYPSFLIDNPLSS
jgi:hypothetical protein